MSELVKYHENDSCPICGDPLLKINGRLICKCCGFIAPYEYDRGLMSHLEKAQFLRKENRFQEALEKYEEILENEPGSLEANYGALLSEYGIEPVKDKDGTYKFTFHRFSYQSFSNTTYYTNIMNNTYGEDNESYLEKIQQLEDLRLQINDEAKKAKKYDVFLCTKITQIDDPTKKTEEYQWAELVYRKLKKMGLNVFFSPYSLPATLGSYEVAIFTALKSAKFMIIFASNEDNLNSPWPKNEWGRFLKFKKDGEGNDRNKEFKLIVKKDMRLNNQELSKQNYIKTSDKDWMDQLIETTSMVFPDLQNSKEFVRGTIITGTGLGIIPEYQEEEYTVDLTNFKRKSEDYEDDLFQSSYKNDVKLMEFGEDFQPIKPDEEKCCSLMESFLKNGNFKAAAREYRDFIDYKGTDEISSKVKILYMYTLAEARNLDDFKENKIRYFKDYNLINKIMTTASVEDAENLSQIFSEYVIRTIKNEDQSHEEREHGFSIYKILANFNNSTIMKLHNSVVNSYFCMLDELELLEKYLYVAFPILVSKNKLEYLEKATIVIEKLVKNRIFPLADKIADEILEIDRNNPSALFVKLKCEYEVNSTTDLLLSIEENNTHKKISDIFVNIDDADAQGYINSIITRIRKLLKAEQYNKVDEWMEVIIGYNFEGRDSLVSEIYQICMNPDNKDTIDLYDSIKKAANDKKTFVTRTNKFADLTLREFGNYDKAKKYYLDVLNYDKRNKHALDGLLATQLEGRFQNIYKVTDFTTMERYITTRETDSEIYEYISNLCNHCVKYVNNNDIQEDNNIFIVFDKLLSYVPKNYEDGLIGIVKTMADILLKKRLFEMATWYNSIILGIDETQHRAYWNILLAKCQVSSTEELKQTHYNIYVLEEYKRAKHHAIGTSDLDEYTSVQIKVKNEKSKKSILPVIIIAAVAVVAIIVLLVILL